MKVLSRMGVQRIKREQIPATLDHVSKLANIPREKLITLGSTGKTEMSGDIDIAIDENEYNPAEIHERMVDILGGDHCKYNYGTRVGSYAVLIEGNSTNGWVQVDLMYVQNVEWAQFSYYSAGDRSKYKGAIRAILLSAVASTINDPGHDYFEYDEKGELLVRVGWGLYLPVGLKRMFQMRGISKKTGGWLKTMKNVKPEEIRAHFPDAVFNDEYCFVDSPELVVQRLFGPDVSPEDVQTAEEILSLIKNKLPQARVRQIFQLAKKRASELADKMEIPEELK